VTAAGESRFGSWWYQDRSSENAHEISAIGDFDADGRAEFLLTSHGAMGVIGLNGSDLSAVATVASGRRLGGWAYDAGEDTVHLAGDFDADGRDEFLITNPWGIGVIGLDGTNFRSRDLVANDSFARSWRIEQSDQYPQLTFPKGRSTSTLVLQGTTN